MLDGTNNLLAKEAEEENEVEQNERDLEEDHEDDENDSEEAIAPPPPIIRPPLPLDLVPVRMETLDRHPTPISMIECMEDTFLVLPINRVYDRTDDTNNPPPDATML